MASNLLDLGSLLLSWQLAMRAERKAPGTVKTYTVQSTKVDSRPAPLQTLASSSRTTPAAGLAMRTALETFEVPRQPVDSVGDVRARTTLLRTDCGPDMNYSCPKNCWRQIPTRALINGNVVSSRARCQLAVR